MGKNSFFFFVNIEARLKLKQDIVLNFLTHGKLKITDNYLETLKVRYKKLKR